MFLFLPLLFVTGKSYNIASKGVLPFLTLVIAIEQPRDMSKYNHDQAGPHPVQLGIRRRTYHEKEIARSVSSSIERSLHISLSHRTLW